MGHSSLRVHLHFEEKKIVKEARVEKLRVLTQNFVAQKDKGSRL
jgi:hypothetical protein